MSSVVIDIIIDKQTIRIDNEIRSKNRAKVNIRNTVFVISTSDFILDLIMSCTHLSQPFVILFP